MLDLCEALGINEQDVIYTGRSIYDLIVEVSPFIFKSLSGHFFIHFLSLFLKIIPIASFPLP